MSWLMYVIIGVLIVGLIAMMVFSRRRAKKQEQDTADLINAVKPGNKVKTIGGVCGVVVEVDNEENTFVLETGTEQSGKCCIKFDKQAIYQTDAVVEKPEKGAKADKQDEAAAEVASEPLTGEAVEEVKAEEAPAEEKPEEKK